MSLDYYLEDIENWKVVCKRDNGEMRGLKNKIIWSLLSIDMNGLKNKADVREFLWRTTFMQAIGKYTENISYDELISHIGIRTNVSWITRAEFIKRKITGIRSDVNYAVGEIYKDIE